MQFFLSKLSSLGRRASLQQTQSIDIGLRRSVLKRFGSLRAEDAWQVTRLQKRRQKIQPQYRDQKQRAMEYLDSTAEQSTATEN